jgi:BirA family biotin operon repressor/biotin-[acetyl-CoA-carboxylase] ligase
MTPSGALSVESIQRRLTTKILGKKILLFQEVDSTNSELMRRAKSGFPEGGTILAESQSQGKGRLGRVWVSPPGVNLYLSLLFRSKDPRTSALLSLLSAVAAAEAIEKVGCSPKIKWPNDLIVFTPAGERKIAGILLELSGPSPSGRASPFVVVGVGINVNIPVGEFPPEIASSATSLFEVLKKEVDRNMLAAEFLNRFEPWYTRLLLGEEDALRSAWIDRSATLGGRVRAVLPQQEIIGVAEGITLEGALMVRTEAGEVQVISSADVIHLRGAT